jgi:phospholipid/cholesterol/gamma-HCH transport system ATP-binding protein
VTRISASFAARCDRSRPPRRVSARDTTDCAFDDPTSGLDPITAAGVDDEILKLRDLERVTSLVATHQMRDAFYLALTGR